ncbi:uncharacterized protein J3R85_016845 [Psidium guajava]|nr:uncharacterized protein J3R85_016845 [Psidium guajava]
MLPDLSDLINLRELNVRFFLGARPRKLVEDPMPWWIGRLSKLESLMLSSEVVVTSQQVLVSSRLETLNLRCPNLRLPPEASRKFIILTSPLLHVNPCDRSIEFEETIRTHS